jgi:hypothetical protein
MSLKYNIKSFYLHLCSLFLRKFLLWIGRITILNSDERLVKHHEALQGGSGWMLLIPSQVASKILAK